MNEQATVSETEQAQPAQVLITINARGEIQGDTSAIDPGLLAQLQTPEAQAMMRKQYKDAHASGRRETRTALAQTRRMVNDGEQRDLRHLRPAGMTKKEFRRLRKQQFRKWSKATLKAQRSIGNGNESNAA
jgi:hypothetical protein